MQIKFIKSRLLYVYRVVIIFIVLQITACTNVFFQPLKQHVATPEQFHIKYEDIYFKGMSGLNLHGWWFPSHEKSKATILFLHGNGENISTHSGFVHWLTQYQYDVFIFDYRGYGKSQGEAQIEGVMNDIQSAREYVVSRAPSKKKLFILGHSMGASMGVYNLARHPENIDGMIFVSPFSDYRQITREMLDNSWLTWAFQWPASLMISTEYNPVDYVASLPDKPKLFIYSADDQIIAADHVTRLYENATGEKYKEQAQGGHNRVLSQKENQQILLRYLDKWSE